MHPLHFQKDPDQTYARQRRYFGALDQLLDANEAGPAWLRQAAVAQVVAEALHFRYGRNYTLRTYCIMANHVHLLVSPLGGGGQPSHCVHCNH